MKKSLCLEGTIYIWWIQITSEQILEEEKDINIFESIATLKYYIFPKNNNNNNNLKRKKFN